MDTNQSTLEVQAAHTPNGVQDLPQSEAEAIAMQQRNPMGWYREMLTTTPVRYDERSQIWHVFGYADVQRVITDYSIFSSDLSQLMSQEEREQRPPQTSLITVDPPFHRQLRGLVTQAFTPRAIAAMEPRIRQIVNEQLDQVIASGRMDVIADLSYPLPVIVIAEMLGVPSTDRADFKRWSDAVVAVDPNDPNLISDRASGEVSPEIEEMTRYFTTMIEQRRQQPQDDLISQMIAAQLDGRHLTQEELLGFCVLLLIAGNITTTSLLSNAIWCFDEQPEAWAQLRADPSLIPGAIEEVLRYRSPVKSLFRVVSQDTEVGGHLLKAGAMVMPWIGAANHDPAQFVEPELFDITRTPNRHISFGHGVHFCLGAPLARLEARVALEEMVRRMETVRIAPGTQLEPLKSFMYGLKQLPVVFTPAQ